MTTPQDAAVVPSDPVVDGELIEDDQSASKPWRVASWWQRSPRVPAALKSRDHAVQATKDTAAIVICAP